MDGEGTDSEDGRESPPIAKKLGIKCVARIVYDKIRLNPGITHKDIVSFLQNAHGTESRRLYDVLTVFIQTGLVTRTGACRGSYAYQAVSTDRLSDLHAKSRGADLADLKAEVILRRNMLSEINEKIEAYEAASFIPGEVDDFFQAPFEVVDGGKEGNLDAERERGHMRFTFRAEDILVAEDVLNICSDEEVVLRHHRKTGSSS